MNSLDRIKRAHIAIMRHPTFCAFSGVVACGKVEVSTDCPTAYTDGFNVTYGDAFVQSLTDAELRFVVLHESVHKSYHHLTVWKDLWTKDKRRTNVAADHFVNLALSDADGGAGFITMPKIGIQPNPEYRGKSVKQIYDLLPDDDEDEDDADNPDGDGGFDQHDFEKAGQPNAAEQQAQAEEIQRALRQGESVARARGKGKGSGSLMADILKPKVDWRAQLREFVQETCAGRDESTWAKPNRRFVGEGVYLPSMISEKMGELVVIFDTSGSCFMPGTVTAFASELAAIVEQVRPDKVRTLYVDDHVHGEQVFEDGQFAVTQLQVRGGGGTDLRLGFDYINEKRYTPQAVIVFTDMYTPFGSAPAYPVLWVSTTDLKAPWGQTTHIEV